MKISHVPPQIPSKLQPLHLVLWASAAIMAVVMFSYYLQLLNQSIVRGQQLRDEVQHASAAKQPAKIATASLLD